MTNFFHRALILCRNITTVAFVGFAMGAKWSSGRGRGRQNNKIVPDGDFLQLKEFVSPEKIQDHQQKITNELHLAAKIGDLPTVLIHLLSGINPFDIDEYDNIPVYYSSLHGHLLCCAAILIKMGGHEKLSDSDRDHCSVNALTLEIKRLFTGDIQPSEILKRELFPPKPQIQHPTQKDPEDEGDDGTMFGNLFQE